MHTKHVEWFRGQRLLGMKAGWLSRHTQQVQFEATGLFINALT